MLLLEAGELTVAAVGAANLEMDNDEGAFLGVCNAAGLAPLALAVDVSLASGQVAGVKRPVIPAVMVLTPSDSVLSPPLPPAKPAFHSSAAPLPSAVSVPPSAAPDVPGELTRRERVYALLEDEDEGALRMGAETMREGAEL